MSNQKLSVVNQKRSRLGKIFLPTANIFKDKLEAERCVESKGDDVLSPVSNALHGGILRVVNYGTGYGKSFSGVNGYLSLVEQGGDGKYHHTVCVFASAKKNQLVHAIGKTHIEKANTLGIAILSLLSQEDMIKHTNKLYCVADDSLDLGSKLVDIIDSVRAVKDELKNAKIKNNKDVNFSHIRLIHDQLIDMQVIMNTYKSLENKLLFANSDIEIDDIKFQMQSKKRELAIVSNVLSKIVIGNQPLLEAKRNEKQPTPSDLDDFEGDQDTEYDETIPTDAKLGYKSFNSDHPNFYNDFDVQEKIFGQAIDKSGFDDPILPLIKGEYSLLQKIATIKKEILRIYSPINYALFAPSIILTTHAKMLTSMNCYRLSETKGVSEWKTVTYNNVFEWVGDKKRYQKAIPKIEGRTEQKEFLLNSLYRHTTSDNPKEDKHGYYNHPVNFYLLIDESNLLMADMGEQGENNGNNSYATIQKILEKESITDIVSSASRFIKTDLDPNNTSFVREYRSFHEHFSKFFYKNSGYSESDFNLEAVMNRLEGITQQLFVNNNDAGVVAEFIQGSFVADSRTFINKQELNRFFIEITDTACGIVTRKNSKSGAIYITLYDYYLIILSCLYASHYYSENISKHNDLLIERGRKDLVNESVDSRTIRNNFSKHISEYIGGHNRDGQRVNCPIKVLVANTTIDKRYIELIDTSQEPNNEEDIIKHWFAQVQTLLVFSLVALSQFKGTKEMKNLTLLDVKIMLRNQSQELELLKSVVSTDNYVYLMSATAGKEVAFASQFNIETLQYFCEMLDVVFEMPEYDATTDTDFKQVSRELYEAQSNTMRPSVNVYEKLRPINDLVANAYDDFTFVFEGQKSYKYSWLSAYPKGFYQTLTQATLNFIATGETFLAVTQNRAFVTDFQLLINNSVLGVSDGYAVSKEYKQFKEVVKEHLELCQKEQCFKPLLIPVMGQCSKWMGAVSFPVLNQMLASFYEENGYDAIEPDKIKEWMLNNHKNATKIIDFLQLPNKLNRENTHHYRLILLDNELSKRVTIADYTIIDKSPYDDNAKIMTGIASYSAVADTGLNLIVKNKLLSQEQDFTHLVIAGMKYYTNMQLGHIGDVQEMIARNICLAYIPYRQDAQQITIAQLNSHLVSFEANNFIRKEHNEIRIDSMKQLIGRVERTSNSDIVKQIIHIDKVTFNEYKELISQFYGLDDSLYPKKNIQDFEFSSFLNRTIFHYIVDEIIKNTLTSEARHRLETDTMDAYDDLNWFINDANGYKKLLEQIRQNKDGENNQKLIRFDTLFRKATILTNPKKWVDEILGCAYVKSNKKLTTIFNKAVIDLADYDDDFKNPNPTKNIFLYESHDGGLTDTLGYRGNNAHIPAYNQAGAFLYERDFGWGRFSEPKGQESRLKDDDTYWRHTEFFKEYNQIANSHFGRYVVHPALRSIILGNLGEHIFRLFWLNIVAQTNNPLNETGKRFKYRDSQDFVDTLSERHNDDRNYHVLYEKYDFFINKKDICRTKEPNNCKDFVLVDVKNMSLAKNEFTTKNLQKRQEDKITYIEQFADIFFDEENHCLSTVVLNVKSTTNDKLVAIEPVVSREIIDKHGNQLTVNTFNLMLFSTFKTDINQLNPNTNKYANERIVIINPTLLELFGLPPAPEALLHLFNH